MMPACARSCVRCWREMNNQTWSLTWRVCILIEEQSKAESAECHKRGSQERMKAAWQRAAFMSPAGEEFHRPWRDKDIMRKGSQESNWLKWSWNDVSVCWFMAMAGGSTGETWLRSTVWVEHTHSSVKSQSQSPSFLSSHIMELENWNISFPCNYAWAARAKESKEEGKLMKVMGKHLKSRQPVLTCSSWASSPHFFLLQSTCHYLWKQQPSWHCETLQEWGYVCGMAEEKARNLLLPQWHHLATVSPTSPHALCMGKKKNSYLSKVTVSQIFFSSQLNKMPTYKPYVRNTACHSREIKVYSIRKKEAESTLHRN